MVLEETDTEGTDTVLIEENSEAVSSHLRIENDFLSWKRQFG